MMVTKKFHVLKTQFDFVNKRLWSKLLYGNMVEVVGSMWVLCCSYFFFVFGFISTYILRLQADDRGNQSRVLCLRHDDQVDVKRSRISDIEVYGEEEEVYFDSTNSKSDDQNREKEEETEDLGCVETVTEANADLYEFRSQKDTNGYMEEPKAMSFVVQELYVGWSNSKGIDVSDQENTEEKTEDVDDQEETEEFSESVCIGEFFEKTLTDHVPSEVCEYTFDSFSFGKFSVAESELDPSDEVQSLADNRSVSSDSEQESVTSGKDHDLGSITYEFLVGRNASEGREPQRLVVIKEDDQQEVKMQMEDFQLHEFSIPPIEEKVVFWDRRDGWESSDDEYIELSKPQMQHSSALEEEVEDQHGEKDELVQDDETKPGNDTAQSEEEIRSQEGKFGLDSNEENEDELPWEHDDIIEQLKMEMRNARGMRLPTILEEDSECTKMVENLNIKPLKIDEKVEFKDRMAEIQKVYKSYAEKMKKLDILNNQTMHAIGFIQLKDQVKSIAIKKSSSIPIVKSLLSQNLWRCKAQREFTAHDPMPKFVGDLHKDFELVYVGQVCLSWEILHWQYGKALELQQCDRAQGSYHQYNLVATEFQLFQVLLQRFIEDDPFKGPRVQHYVKNRCVLRSLLQVPAIKDDKMHDKKSATKGEEDLIILSETLVKIIEESMRIFWQFLCKDEKNLILKGFQEMQVDRKDLEPLMDIRKELQKKDKKLKDIQRIRNCVVKKFQKHQEDRLAHTLWIAQVELRLISRVLNMSKLKAAHLEWCHEKLGKINFVHRKVHMEPSFLLFPC